MHNDYIYSTDQFNWCKELNTFFGDANNIWDIDLKYHYPFPSEDSDFIILNENTGGHRRFRLKSEDKETHYCVNTFDGSEGFVVFRSLLFESEDGIFCKIYEEIPNTDVGKF